MNALVNNPRTRDLMIALVLLIIAIAIPQYVTSRYYLGEIAMMFTWIIVASQWNLLFGVAGVFNLAHMVVFAWGGYVTAILGAHFGWSYWYAVPVGAISTILFATVIGAAALRLTGAYVALLTLAIAEVVRQLVISDTECFVMRGTTCVQFAGGASGLTGFGNFGTRPVFRGDYAMADYYILLAVMTIVLILTYGLMRGPIGLGLRAMGSNARYATSRGINRFKFQMFVFGISALFTGLAGALHAGRIGSISPQGMMSLEQLLFIIGMVVVGGVGKFWGPIVGAILLSFVSEWMREFGDLRLIGQGLILAIVVVLMPTGIVGLVEKIAARFERSRP